ncbi:MAG: SpoIIIAH-like family protein [Firmicutes bacterium]|nr:SpoIIIAH-like family protein [Bacillota bacterium]
MFKLKRNQIIITALVVMIAVAGYLNYVGSKNPADSGGIALNDQGEVSALIPDTLGMTNAADETSIGDAIAFDDNPTIDTTMSQTGAASTDGAAADAALTGAAADTSLTGASADTSLTGTASDTSSTVTAADTSSSVTAADTSMTGTTQAGAASDAASSDAAQVSSGAVDNGTGTQTDNGKAVFVNTSNDSSYFVQAKLDREQARSKEKDLLTDIINNTNIEQTQKAQAGDAMLEIIKRIEKETAAEAMIESKGFSEVYVRIDDTSVDVVVNKAALTDAEVAQIEDIVKRKTGMAVDQIHISPMR